MSKRKTPYPESSPSSQPIIALGQQKEELLNLLQILNTPKEALQKKPRPGEKLENRLKRITQIQTSLQIQGKADDKKSVRPFYKKRRQVEKKGELLLKSIPTLDLMPMALLVYTASFLGKIGLAHLTLVSKLFLTVDWEDARLSYRKKLADFDHLKRRYDVTISSMNSRDPLADVKQWRLFKKIPEYSHLFSTVINKSYIPLFMALQASDQQAAIHFINYKLKVTAGTKENVTDMVFLQKKWDGESAIMLANRLGLQDFLSYCFYHLIDFTPDQKILPAGRKLLIKTDKLENLFAHLETEMFPEALWVYAAAYVCNLISLCEQISSKAHWESKYSVEGEVTNPDANLSLALIAAFLGSRSLMNYVLEQSSDHEKGNFMHFTFTFDSYKTRNNLPKYVTPLVIALQDNNVELVNDLLPLTLRTIDPSGRSERSRFLVSLLLFYIKHQNLTKLAECLKEFDEVDGEVLVKSIGIYPQFYGIPGVVQGFNKHRLLVAKEQMFGAYSVLDVAIDSGWRAGADLLLSTAVQLIRNGEGQEILYTIIFNDNLSVLKELVARGVSLFDKYSVPEVDHLEYPLITAIRVLDISEVICDFIIQEIGDEVALQQIKDRQENFTGDSADIVEGLSEFRDQLERNLETETEAEFIPQPISPVALSLFSSGSSAQTTSVPSSSSPAPNP